MHTTRQLALTALMAAVLTACGGGGGGGSPSDTGGTGAPLGGTGNAPAAGTPSAGAPVAGSPSAGAPAPAPGAGTGSPAPAPAAFQAFEPVRVGSAPLAAAPAVARLASGGNVVAWAAPGSGSRDSRILLQRTDAAGNLVGGPVEVALEVDRVMVLSAAAAADGGFIVVWSGFDSVAQTPGASVFNVRASRFDANGQQVSQARVSPDTFYSVSGVDVRATADGGFVVGWTSQSQRMAPAWAHLQRLDANGQPAGPVVQILQGGDFDQSRLVVLPLPDGRISTVWLQSTFGSRPNYRILSRLFSADLVPLGVAFDVPQSAQNEVFPIGAALVGGNVAIAWRANLSGGTAEVRSLTVAPTGAQATPERSVSSPMPVGAVQVVTLGDTYGVVWQELEDYSRGRNARLRMQRYDASGAPVGGVVELAGGAVAWVSPTTGFNVVAGTGIDVAGGADGHLVGSFQRADETQPNTYLFGR
jgi:hypothetical protein